MTSLLFSISGLRGVVGSGLTPEIITEYAAAFGYFLDRGKIVIGRDTRVSGDMIKHAVLAGLLSSGCEVLDLDVVPTPTINLMVREIGASGGIAITASHNPIEWNALKFINRTGIFLNGQEAEGFVTHLKKREFRRVGWDEIKKVNTRRDGVEIHIDKVIGSKICSQNLKKLKIGVDAVNGAGSIAIPRLLEKMKMVVYPVFCTPDGNFPRAPEPVDENLDQLKNLVKEKQLDLAFAVDPDSDRLAIIDDQGKAIGEEKTLVLAAKYVLTKNRGPLVTNLSTTQLMDDIAAKYNVELHRTKVGEANVVNKMKEINAVVGGEGNGGVVLPEVNMTRDALVGIMLIVNLISSEGKRISEICEALPNYVMFKKKIVVKDWKKQRKLIVAQVQKHEAFLGGRVDETDGLKFLGQRTWLHIRSSQTEPIVRVIAEGEDEARIKKLIDEVVKLCVA